MTATKRPAARQLLAAHGGLSCMVVSRIPCALPPACSGFATAAKWQMLSVMLTVVAPLPGDLLEPTGACCSCAPAGVGKPVVPQDHAVPGSRCKAAGNDRTLLAGTRSCSRTGGQAGRAVPLRWASGGCRGSVRKVWAWQKGSADVAGRRAVVPGSCSCRAPDADPAADAGDAPSTRSTGTLPCC